MSVRSDSLYRTLSDERHTISISDRRRSLEQDSLEPSRSFVLTEAPIVQATHSGNSNLLQHSRNEAGLCLWADSVRVRAGNKVILESTNIVCRGGELTVLLGPSGVGKTTLLNVLTGRIKKFEGRAGLNNEKVEGAVGKYLVNYVMAQDLLNEYLTVKELLLATAQLKLPHKTKDECQEVCDQLMNDLKISHCKDTLVGGPWRKGISKGETKRLAVAAELIGKPCALILDEPTTGLDSSISYELIKILKRLARERNLAILCTLHQPNQRIYDLIDSVVIMGGTPGRVLYQGAPAKALPYLRSQGLCTTHEPGTSEPDAIMDALVTRPHEQSAILQDRAASRDSRLYPQGYQSESELDSSINKAAIHDEKQVGQFRVDDKRSKWHQADLSHVQPLQMPIPSKLGPLPHRDEISSIMDAQSWVKQFGICCYVHFMSNLRNPLTLLLMLLVSIVQSLLLGALFYKVDSDMSDITTPLYTEWPMFNSSALRYMTYGMSNEGPMTKSQLYDPLADMLARGINVDTAASMIFDIVANPDMIDWTWEFAKCVRSNVKDASSDYDRWNWFDPVKTLADHSFSENQLFYERPERIRALGEADALDVQRIELPTAAPEAFDTVAPDAGDDPATADAMKDTQSEIKTSTTMPPWTGPVESGACWNDVHGYKETHFKQYTIPQAVSAITGLMQVMDTYQKNPGDWPVVGEKNNLLFWLSFQTALQDSVDLALCCAGNEYGMINPLTDAKTCKERYPTYDFPVWPGRMYWFEGLRDEWPKLRSLLEDPYFKEYVREQLDNVILPGLKTLKRNLRTADVSDADQVVHHRYSANVAAVMPEPGMAAPRRNLGTGVGGMVTDLLKLLSQNPDSPVYKLMQAFRGMWNQLESDTCATGYCSIITTSVKAAEKASWDLLQSVMTVLNIASVIFFMVANLGFCCYDILLQFPKMRAIFNRERANGMYRTSSFLLAKMFADVPFHIVPGLVWSIVYVSLVGMDLAKLGQFIGIAALIVFTAYSMGYLVSSVVLQLETSIVLSPLILVAMLVLAGFFLRDAAMPKWIAWARYLSIYRWSYFAVLLVQFPPKSHYGPLPNALCLTLAGVTENSLGKVCSYLVAISIGCRIATYFALSFLHTKQGLQA